jgi:hypothetical protein
MDLEATCCSMALAGFEPDEALWARIQRIRKDLAVALVAAAIASGGRELRRRSALYPGRFLEVAKSPRLF